MLKAYVRPTFAGVLVCMAGSAMGQINASWSTAVSDNWSNPLRWSTNPDIPNNGANTYNAMIAATGSTYGVTLDQNITIVDFNLNSADATLMYGGAFQLTVQGNCQVQGGSIIDGQNLGGGLSAAGTTTFGDCTLRQLPLFMATGPVHYASGTSVLADDTDIDHGDGSALWDGTGDIVLANGSTITNGPTCVFTISNSKQMRWNNAGGAPVFTNQGTIVRNTSAGVSEVLGVAFTNSGTLDVQTGTFRADTVASISAGTLSGGTYRVGGGSLDFVGASITSNSATVEFGSGAGTFAAFDPLATNNAAGIVRVLTGRTYTKPGALSNAGLVDVQAGATLNSAALTNQSAGVVTLGAGAVVTSTGNVLNNGTVNVGAGATYTVATGSTLQNVSGVTLSGGTFNIAGSFKADNLSGITTLGSRVLMDGPASTLRDASNTDIIPGIRIIQNGGELGVLNGRNTTTTGNLTLGTTGKLTVGAGTTFTVGGTITNFSGGTFTSGIVDVSGVLQFNGAAITTVDAAISLNSPASNIVDENNNNALAALNTITSNGSLAMGAGRSLTLAGGLTQSGQLSVGAGSTLTASGAVNQSAGSVTTLNSGGIAAPGGYNLTGGSLQGSGSITGPSVINGTVAPGFSPGLLTFTGPMEIDTNSLFLFEIGGPARGVPGGYDAIDLSGLLSFESGSAGVFRLSLLPSYIPAIGDQFFVIGSNGRAGQFADIQGTTGLPGGLRFEAFYDMPFPGHQGQYLMLEVVPAPAGVGLAGVAMVLGMRRRRSC